MDTMDALSTKVDKMQIASDLGCMQHGAFASAFPLKRQIYILRTNSSQARIGQLINDILFSPGLFELAAGNGGFGPDSCRSP
jgi:hypothetical protein